VCYVFSTHYRKGTAAMPTYTVVTYRCPKCKADVGRRFGLHTKLWIACPNCGSNVRIGRDVIAQNWGFNFGWVGGLIIWLVLGVGVLVSPELAAQIGRQSLPADTFENRLVIAGVCGIPALLAALVVGGIGMVCGYIAAACASDAETPAAEHPSWPPSNPGQWTPGGFPRPNEPAPQPPRPRGRNFLVRAFFVLLWPVVAFVGAVIVVSMVASVGAKPVERQPTDVASTVGLLASPLGQGPLLAAASLVPDEGVQEQQREAAATKMGERSAPWLLLSTLIVFVLGCVGLLPLTGSGRKRQAEARPDVQRLTEPAPSSAWRYNFGDEPPVPAPAPEPPRRNVLVRVSFVLLWPAVFFIGAGLATAALAGGFSAADEETQKHIFKQSAEANVLWIMLVSLLLFVTGCLGYLPGTGAKKRKPARGAGSLAADYSSHAPSSRRTSTS
jgi:DNA-directed RNA polymerase subunit RPC12/RpoP